MDQALLVDVLQAQADLADVVAGLRRRQGSDVAEELGQVDPLDVFHDEEEGAVDLIGVEGRDDVGMREAGGRPDLPPEPLHQPGDRRGNAGG